MENMVMARWPMNHSTDGLKKLTGRFAENVAPMVWTVSWYKDSIARYGELVRQYDYAVHNVAMHSYLREEDK